MAHLDIKPDGGDNYSFMASGCHLKYFVIWKGGESPTTDDWIEVYGSNNYYQLPYPIKNDKGINFHVYDGNYKEHFRGKMFYPPEKKKKILEITKKITLIKKMIMMMKMIINIIILIIKEV